MRRPIYLMQQPQKQQGFSLFIVLMMMIVIALLVVAATQTYSTELRISTNDADRKNAMNIAEAALRAGEGEIANLDDPSFTQNCINGLCSAAGAVAATQRGTLQGTITVAADASNQPAWLRTCGGGNCLDENGLTYATQPSTPISKPARYIIEYLGTNKGTATTIYRVTARAWGENANTVVTVQSYVESTSEE